MENRRRRAKPEAGKLEEGQLEAISKICHFILPDGLATRRGVDDALSSSSSGIAYSPKGSFGEHVSGANASKGQSHLIFEIASRNQESEIKNLITGRNF